MQHKFNHGRDDDDRKQNRDGDPSPQAAPLPGTLFAYGGLTCDVLNVVHNQLDAKIICFVFPFFRVTKTLRKPVTLLLASYLTGQDGALIALLKLKEML
jgi:hypothetical protein